MFVDVFLWMFFVWKSVLIWYKCRFIFYFLCFKKCFVLWIICTCESYKFNGWFEQKTDSQIGYVPQNMKQHFSIC